MGTIVYSNLVELLLKEGDKTKEEIIKESVERFGFTEDRLPFEVGLQLKMGESFGFFSKDENEKYRLLRYHDEIFGRKNFLEILKRGPEDYFERLPSMKKLKDALEEAELRK